MAEIQSTRAACLTVCRIPGCAVTVGRGGARGMCPTHYSRWRRSGDAGAAERLTRTRKGQCDISGCDRQILSRGLCRVHRDRLALRGTVSISCDYCGLDMTNRVRARRFCSAAHAAMFHRHAGERPEVGACLRCGGSFSLLVTGKAGRTKRADAKMCPDCRKARMTRHGWSPKAIVAHHGTSDCGICGEPVDLSLRKPNLMSASIDHIVPFAHGGSNDPENLQLAHLHCNHVKSDSGYNRGRRVKSSGV